MARGAAGVAPGADAVVSADMAQGEELALAGRALVGYAQHGYPYQCEHGLALWLLHRCAGSATGL